VLERDYRLKLAMGFPPEHFTRAWELLRQPLPDLVFDPSQHCAECNRSGAAVIGDRLLCADCYSARGSCCVEFEGDDE
jgi:hypothetical protein